MPKCALNASTIRVLTHAGLFFRAACFMGVQHLSSGKGVDVIFAVLMSILMSLRTNVKLNTKIHSMTDE